MATDLTENSIMTPYLPCELSLSIIYSPNQFIFYKVQMEFNRTLWKILKKKVKGSIKDPKCLFEQVKMQYYPSF